MAPTEEAPSSGQVARHGYLQRFVAQVQEKLLAPGVADIALRKAARVLRPADYDAVVEERLHMRRCGLPTCANALPDTGPAAPKYRIRRAAWQVVLTQPPALRPYCSGDCAARSAAYHAGLSDVHLQFREIVKPAAPARPGPVRAQVVERAPPTPNESLAAANSFADMLFELSRVARGQLEGVDSLSSGEAADLLMPEPIAAVAAETRSAALTRFGRLFVTVSRWCNGSGPSSDDVLDRVRERVRRCCPSSYLPVVERDLGLVLARLDFDADEERSVLDDDWTAVCVAIIMVLLRKQALSELCEEGCRHSLLCLTGRLKSTGYDRYRVDCIAQCILEKIVQEDHLIYANDHIN